MNSFLIIIRLITVCLIISVPLEASCDLKWVSSYGGYRPSNAVSVWSGHHREQIYVGRYKFSNHEMYPGYMVPSKGKIYFAAHDKEYGQTQYEILTNPNNCTLQWIHVPSRMLVPPPYAIQAGISGSKDTLYIAKAYRRFEPTFARFLVGCSFADTTLLGRLNPTAGVYISYCGKVHLLQSNFEILTLRYDLNLEIIALKYNISQEELLTNENQKFLIFDRQTVSNPTEISIEKTLSFEQSLSQTFEYKFTEVNKFQFSISAGLNFPFNIGSIGSSSSFSHDKKESFTSTQTVDKKVSFQNKLIIPPRTSITATAMINWIENHPIAFTAIARITNPHMNATQVKEKMELLQTRSKFIKNIDNGVEVEIIGTVKASMGFDSKLEIRTFAL